MAEHGGAPAPEVGPNLKNPPPWKEHDAKFYQICVGYLIDKNLLSQCRGCNGGKWKRDGAASGTYRIRCTCGKTAGMAYYRQTVVEHYAKIAEEAEEAEKLKVYPTPLPMCQKKPVLKLSTKKRRAQTTPLSEDEEDEDEKEEEKRVGLAEDRILLKKLMEQISNQNERILEQDSRLKKQDEQIRQLLAELDQLKKNEKKETTPTPTPPSAKKKGIEKKPHGKPTGTKAPQTPQKPAWKEEKPDWVTIGKKGKPVKAPPQINPRQSTTISDEDVRRFVAGETPRQKGLEFLYIRGAPRRKYSFLKGILQKMGIDPKWIKHISTTGKDTLEILIYKERAEEAKKIIQEKMPNFALLEEHEALPSAPKDLKNAEARMKRQIGKLPTPMHYTRRVLNEQLVEVQRRLTEATKKKEDDDSKGMEVETPKSREEAVETVESGPCNGTQRTDV